ncbi:MAG: TolC family protein [Bacteroidia bacterium]|nr:TolC family protein [Bacteroidia bacterium]
MEIQKQKVLRGGAFDIPKTNLDFRYGNVNNADVDHSLELSQSFYAPGVYKHRRRFYDKNYELQEENLRVVQNQLIFDVKMAYLDLSYRYETLALLREQDTLAQNLFRLASVKRQVGESGALEEINAETRLRDMQQQQRQTEMEISIRRRVLQKLLNSAELPEIRDKALPFAPLQDDNPELTQNPQLALRQKQIEVQMAYERLQKSLLAPDFKVGYFNMQESANPNLHAVILGVGIPLFNRGIKAQIKAARLDQEIAQIQWDYEQRSLNQELDIQLQNLLRLRASLEYYQSYALPLARQISQNSVRSYEVGEIEYTSLIQNRGYGYEIRKAYLQDLYAYHQTLARIEYLKGNDQ